VLLLLLCCHLPGMRCIAASASSGRQCSEISLLLAAAAAAAAALCIADYRDALRAGKRFLKEANGSAAMVRFEKALMLSMALDNKVRAAADAAAAAAACMIGCIVGCHIR
jgi:hypothetical protein